MLLCILNISHLSHSFLLVCMICTFICRTIILGLSILKYLSRYVSKLICRDCAPPRHCILPSGLERTNYILFCPRPRPEVQGFSGTDLEIPQLFFCCPFPVPRFSRIFRDFRGFHEPSPGNYLIKDDQF